MNLIDIDGNTYNIIKIGVQYWTVENLRTTKYNDGTPITFIDNKSAWSRADDNKTPAYCFYNDDAKNKQKYGALYNWYAVNTGKLAPTGWRVPSKEDWYKLENFLMANGYRWEEKTTNDNVAKSMAATSDWKFSSNNGAIGNDLSRNNKSGFSALPSGNRDEDGNFYGILSDAHYWSSSKYDINNAHYYYLFYDDTDFFWSFYHGMTSGFSVRCVFDL